MAHPIHSYPYNLLAELLIARRQELGLLQTEVAERLNKPQSFVSKYENVGRRLDVSTFFYPKSIKKSCLQIFLSESAVGISGHFREISNPAMDSLFPVPISCACATIFSIIMVLLFLFSSFSHLKGSSFYGNC